MAHKITRGRYDNNAKYLFSHFCISDFNSSAESKILICFMLAEWEAFAAKNKGG
jgi:hypothetical protein